MAAEPATPTWPCWQGPRHNGSTPESSGWPKGWPPKKLWDKDVGVGASSPIIADGKVYVLGWQGPDNRRENPRGRDAVRCLDAADGKILWEQSYPARYQGRHREGDIDQYGGALATPALDRETGTLYTLGVDGDLRSWDAARGGRPGWELNLYEAFKVPPRPDLGGGRHDYGFTASPLVWGDLLLVEVGGPRGTLVALDKATGRTRWRSVATEPAGHTGGLAPITLDGRNCLAVLTLTKLLVIDAGGERAGATVAEWPWQTDYACNIATPAIWGPRVLLTSAYNQHRTALVDFSGPQPRELWTAPHHAIVSSPVIHKGRAFLVDARLMCLDLAGGKLLWKGGDFGLGSCLVTADDKLIVFGNGRLSLADAAANEFRELSHVEHVVRGTCYPHVAFAGGFIVCRDQAGRLACLSVAGGP
jgi:outer membrane protein assembly factor BamB